MTTTLELEKRVERIECEIDEIKKQFMKPRTKPHPKAWLNTVGIFKDDPEFDEMVRLGREYRESQPCPQDV